jgi:hypothetical protein
MKPPRCYVCGVDHWTAPPGPTRDQFVLVYFADHVEMPPDWVGHPRNAVWFCAEHARLGREREALTTDVALAEIDAVTRDG